MKSLFLSIFSLSTLFLQAQYYYNDIVGTQETNRTMQTYIANKVKMVSADGYTGQGAKTNDFIEVQEVKENGKVLKIVTIAKGNRTSSYNRFDEKSRVISITDTSLGVANTTNYEYDNTGRLILVKNTVKDPENEINTEEIHQWYYNNNGKPERMWRIVNGKDSLEIRFPPDEKGNPGEEVSYRRGKEADRIYYYFDDEGNLSDIVRFNDKIKKLVPDNMMTYDESKRVIQAVKSNPADKYGKITWVSFQTWRYVYNDKGLKTDEVLFNEANERTGRIKYTYIFFQ